MDAEAVCRSAAPKCLWFAQGKCKKGSKCKLLHETGPESRPQVSCSFDASKQQVVMRIRPPLEDAWERFFRGGPVRVQPDTQRRDDKVMLRLAHMTVSEDNKSLSSQTSKQGYVDVGRARLYACGKPFPQYMGHGTDLPSAFSILRSGTLLPSSGICGNNGIYGFRIGSEARSHESFSGDFMEACASCWDMTVSGGYNHGCMFVLACNGCLINGNFNLEIPPGSIAAKDQAQNLNPPSPKP